MNTLPTWRLRYLPAALGAGESAGTSFVVWRRQVRTGGLAADAVWMAGLLYAMMAGAVLCQCRNVRGRDAAGRRAACRWRAESMPAQIAAVSGSELNLWLSALRFAPKRGRCNVRQLARTAQSMAEDGKK